MTPSAAESSRRARPTRTGRNEEVDEAPSEQAQSRSIPNADARLNGKASKNESKEPNAVAVRQGGARREQAESAGGTERGEVSTAAQREVS